VLREFAERDRAVIDPLEEGVDRRDLVQEVVRGCGRPRQGGCEQQADHDSGREKADAGEERASVHASV
jgi:hypothetical protein